MSSPGGPEHAQAAVREQLLDNEEVRVIATTYPPGAGVAMHEHPYPHVVYVIEGGTVETTGPDGRTQRLEVAPGRTFWREAQSHSTRNVGDSQVRIVEVEIKNAGAARARSV
jgi:beta-alanine degradation protein BauB